MSESERAARRVLQDLPAREREVVIRYYLEGQSPEQIEISLGIGTTEFFALRTRARNQFRRLRGYSARSSCEH